MNRVLARASEDFPAAGKKCAPRTLAGRNGARGGEESKYLPSIGTGAAALSPGPGGACKGNSYKGPGADPTRVLAIPHYREHAGSTENAA